MSVTINAKGTSVSTFAVGKNKLTLDASNLTEPRSWIFPNSNGSAGQILTTDGSGNLSWTNTGSGSVTSVSIVTANGISGSVATPTSTPAITLTLGAITPTSVAATGTVTGSNLSGTNTGDQTITLTGDVTGSGTGSFAATLATVNSSPQTDQFRKITVNGKGLVTATSPVVASDITSLVDGTYVNVSGDTMTGALGIIAGTNTAPGLYFSGDTNTGIYSPAADSLSITAAGSEVVRIVSNNVLFGSAAAYSTRQGTNSITPLIQTASSSTNTSSQLLSYWNSDSTGTNLFFAKSRSGSVGAQAVVNNDDNLGSLSFAGSDGTQFTEAARISSVSDGTTTTNSISGRLVFLTTNGGTTPVERLRINSTGALGFAGANFGSSGQILVSGGSGTTPAWADLGTVGDSRYVLKTGDTMTGALVVDGSTITAQRYGSTGAFISRRANGTISVPTAVSAAESPVGIWVSRAYDGAAYRDVGNITLLTQTGTTPTSSAGFMQFNVTPEASTTSVEVMRLTAGGQLFLGTATALGGPGATRFTQAGTSFSTSSASWGRFSNDNDGAYLTIEKSRSTTISNYTVAVTSGDSLGRLQFRGADGTSSVAGAELSTAVDGTVSTGVVPARFVFSTENSAGVFAERMRLSSEGNLGIGAVPTTQRLFVGGSSTGAISTTGTLSAMTIQSDVTTSHNSFATFPSTSAATFTLNELRHYVATQSTFGVGSTVTSQYGYLAGSSLVGATNNYGFFGDIPAGTNRWNTYMSGTAPNFMNGSLGVGTTGVSGNKVIVGGNMTGSASYSAVGVAGTVQSDVTSNFNAFATFPATQATAFSLTSLHHYNASQGTFGAGSDVTFQYGFRAQSNLIGATNNYAFVGEIPAATGRWNLFMSGTAVNYMAGALRIGNTLSGFNGLGSGNLLLTGTDYTTSNSQFSRFSNDNDSAYLTFSKSRSGTVGTYTVVQNNDALGRILFVGADGTQGRTAASISSMAEGTPSAGIVPGRITFQTTNSTGSTLERMRINSEGNVGIGTSTITGFNLRVQKDMTGATFVRNIYAGSNPLSDVTTGGSSVESVLTIPSGTALSGSWNHFYAQQGTFTGTLVSQSGFVVDANMTGATNNFGFFGNLSAATGRWNFYAQGNAWNFFAGKTLLNSSSEVTTSGVSAHLQINGTSNTSSSLTITRNAADANGALLYLGKGRSTVGNAATAIVSDDILGNIIFVGTDTSAYSPGSTIRARSSGTWSTTSVPTRLEFLTVPSGSTTQQIRLIISETGALGVGGANYGTSGQVLVSAGSGSTPSWSSDVTLNTIDISTNGEITSANLTTTTTTANQVVATYSASAFRSAKMIVQVSSGSSYQVSEILIVHNGTTAFMTEYGIVQTGSSLASFDSDISGGNLRLLVTPVNASSVIKVITTLVTV